MEYTSQDFCQLCEYDDLGGDADPKLKGVDSSLKSKVDIVCDITDIPKEDASYDIILCTEVFEHVPDPLLVLKEFSRLLKLGGSLILTAPFASMVHLAPYHFSSGFSNFWYEYHLPRYGFKIDRLEANGDWFSLFHQECSRLGYMARKYGDWSWPLAYLLRLLGGGGYFKIRSGRCADDVACFGWHCLATKVNG